MKYYSFHIGDYAKKTGHLTESEDLAYRRLLDYYYDNELPIQNDPKAVARLIRMGDKTEIVASVLSEFFYLGDDKNWHHSYADNQIRTYIAQKEAGARGGRSKKNNSLVTHPTTPPTNTLQATSNQEPVTSNQKPITHNQSYIKLARPFTAEEVRTAKKGEAGYDPLLIDCDILPDGWYDFAYEVGLDDKAILGKFRYMRDRNPKPLSREHWVNIVSYKGAGHAKSI